MDKAKYSKKYTSLMIQIPSQQIRYLIYVFLFLFIISTTIQVSGAPLPIYGKAILENGQNADLATVTVQADGYPIESTNVTNGSWQVDVGPETGTKWIDGTVFEVLISKGDWMGNKTGVIDGNYINVGLVVLYNSNDTSDNDSASLLSPSAILANHGFFESMVGKTVFFDGVDSYDPDGMITGFRWDFNGDGLFDTDWLDEGVITHMYNSPGFYEIALEVRDDSNLTDTVEGFVDISNDPPLLEIIGPVDGLTSEMNTFIYQLSMSKTILNVTWMIDEDILSYDTMLNHVFTSAGYHIIKIMVTDDMNDTFSDAHQIHILVDTDKDKIADDIENKIGTPIWTKNNATDVIIDGTSHLLVDSDQDGTYDVFFNTTQMNSSLIKIKDDSLLIDDDLDDSYEYRYKDGVLSSYEGSGEDNRDNDETPSFTFGVVVLAVFLIMCILVLRKKQK